MFRCTFSVAILLSIFVGPIWGQADSWAGKVVILKSGPVKLVEMDANGNIKATDDSLDATAIAVGVLSEKNGFAKIQFGTKERWFPKEHALLPDDAIPFFTKEIEKDPQKLIAIVSRGFAHLYKKEYDSTIRDYSAAIELNPKIPGLFLSRGDLYLEKNGDLDKSLPDFNEAIKLDPKMAGSYRGRGAIFYKKKEFAKAIKDFDKAIELNHYNLADLHNYKGMSYLWLKEYDQADQDLKKALNFKSATQVLFGDYAFFLATCPDAKYRDGKKALEIAKQACEKTQFKDGQCLASLSLAYAELGQFDQAIRYQTQAMDDPYYRLHYAEDGRKHLDHFRKKMPYRLD